MRDAGLHLKNLKLMPPIICIVAAKMGETTNHVVERCQKEMAKAGNKWAKVLARPSVGPSWERTFAKPGPTIYGITVKYGVMCFLSFDPNMGAPELGGKPVRLIGTYNWEIMEQDVWHALAVAIVACKARNCLMELNAEELLGPDRVESDRDA